METGTIVAKRERDYKAEYQRRKLRAQREGWKGYSQKRKSQLKAKTFAERLAERMTETGLIDAPMWSDPDYTMDDLLGADDANLFWDLIRAYYARMNTA